MTLKELYSKINGTKEEALLGKKSLCERNEKVIARWNENTEDEANAVQIQVFESGYVLYEEGDNATVFHLDEVLKNQMIYDTVDSEISEKKARLIPEQVFMTSEWTLSLLLFGNDRIYENRDKLNSKRIDFSYSDMSDEIGELGYTPDFLEPFLTEIENEKMGEVFQKVRSSLKPIQWKIYVMAERDGMKQKDISDELGISQQAVSKHYKKACEKILELREYLKKIYYEN